MAFYVMGRLSDGMHGEGERLYPRLVGGQVIDTERIAEIVERRTSFTHGDVVGVLSEVAAIVAETMAQGSSLKIDGLGVLRPVLGLVDKEQRGEWTDSSNRTTTGRNVRLKTVGFRPDTALLRNVGRDMTLERVSDRLGRELPTTTVEERAAMARQYLSANGYMRVTTYAHLTGLSRTAATIELRQLAEDGTSGIKSSGSGPSKIYVSANK